MSIEARDRPPALLRYVVSSGRCAWPAAAAGRPAPPPDAPPPAASAVHGLDLAAIDRLVEPGDDFFTYANGEWLARTEIPADRSSWGPFAMTEPSSARTQAARAKATARPPRVAAQQAVDFYTAFMDEAGIEAKGAAPLKPLLAKIAAIDTALSRARWAHRCAPTSTR